MQTFRPSLLLLLSLALSAGAAAQEGEPRPAEAPTVRDIDEIATRLDSQNPDEVREAIDLLSVIDHPSVVPHLAQLLREGCVDAVTDRALQALRGLGHASAVDVLVEFTHHRRARARRLAYAALGAIDDRRIPALIEQGLRDSDRTIRANAARTLGELGASRSVETLFLALDRGVVEAAGAIGKVGAADTVPRFTAHLGQLPLSVMLSGYQEYVRRDDIPDEVKLEIVGRLGEVSGPLVRSFLQRYLDTFPTRGRAARSNRVRQVVVDTLRRIPGHAGSVRGREVPSGPGGGR